MGRQLWRRRDGETLLDAINIKSNDGWTALMHASQNSHSESKHSYRDGQKWHKRPYGCPTYTKVVKGLLKAEVDVNTKSKKDGWTALVKQGHSEIVQTLLLAGANPEIKTKKSSTALTLAAEKNHIDIVMMLAQQIIKQSLCAY